MAILDALARKQGFTKTEEALADYALHHAEAVADMNIGELASAAYVSNASADATIPERFPDVSCFLQLPEGESVHHKIATYYAQTCIRYALECVYGECFSLNYRKNLDRIDDYDRHRGSSYGMPE